jgi:iron complex transport system substrate-binding protein
MIRKKIKISYCLPFLALLLLPLSVLGPALSHAELEYPFTFLDDNKREITLTSAPKRIISIGPANTEILFAIGAEQLLVGVDRYSDYPEAAKKIERVGGLLSPFFDKIVALNPDLVIVGTSTHPEIMDKLVALNLRVASIAPKNLDKIYQRIELFGQICDKSAEADQVVRQMKDRVKSVREVVEIIPKSERKTVFYEVWYDPLQSAGPGSFIHALIELGGGINIAGDAKTAWPLFSLETVVARNPQVIFTTRKKSVTELLEGHRKAWNRISAVEAKRVYQLNGDEISRPGPRIVRALEAMAQRLYPELFEEKMKTGDKGTR